MRQLLTFIFIPALLSFFVESNATAAQIVSGQNDSISKPHFSNPALNQSIDELTAQLDRFYEEAVNGTTTDNENLREKLLRIQQNIFEEAEALTDEEVQQIFSYFENYASTLEMKLDKYFQELIDAAQAELDRLKKEQEEAKSEVEFQE